MLSLALIACSGKLAPTAVDKGADAAPSGDAGQGSGGAGASGESGGAGKGGAPSGAGGTTVGAGGMAAVTGGAGGRSGPATGGASSTGGTSSTGGASTGGVAAGGCAGKPTGSGGASAAEGKLPDLQGPVIPDQAPLIIDQSKFVEPLRFAVRPVSDLEGGVIAAVIRQHPSPAPVSTLERYDANLQLVWSRPLSFHPADLSVKRAGDIFLAGTTGLGEEVYSNESDLVVARYSGDGTLVWTDTWGSDLLDLSLSLSGMADGAVVGVARCDGQAPGNAPEHAGALVFYRYDSAGNRTVLRQSLDYRMPVDEHMGDLYVNAAGTIRYGVGNIYPSASTGPRDGVRFIDASTGAVRAGGNIATTKRDCPACGSRPGAIGEDQHITWLNGLASVSRNGDSLWYRARAIQTAVLDSPEGTEWTGYLFGSGPFEMVEPSGLVLTGTYRNAYQTGCTQRETYHAYIGKYSSTGDRVWFQEYATEASIRRPTLGATFDVISVVPLGNDYAVFTRAGTVDVSEDRYGAFVFKIRGSDGTLMP